MALHPSYTLFQGNHRDLVELPSVMPLRSSQLSGSSQPKSFELAIPRRQKKAPTPDNDNEALTLLTQQQVLQLTEARATLANVLTQVRETPLHNFTSAQDRRTLSAAQSCLDAFALDLRRMPTQSKKRSNRSNWHSWCVKDKQRGKFIILTCPHLPLKECRGKTDRGCAVAPLFHLVRRFTP